MSPAVPSCGTVHNESVTRRSVLYGGAVVAGAALTGAGFIGGVAIGRSGTAVREEALPHGPAAAWAALQRGNARWAAGEGSHPHQSVARRREVSAGQSPYAVVLSCIDSRVPPEVVFDAGVGDLLVVRTAAHTLDPLVTAAVQYGPQDLNAPLIVVLGHQRCGAVTAAAHALHDHATLPGELPRIVEALQPAYRRSGGEVDAMIRENVVEVTGRLRADPLLGPLVNKGALGVVGARYSLDTGQVARVI